MTQRNAPELKSLSVNQMGGLIWFCLSMGEASKYLRYWKNSDLLFGSGHYRKPDHYFSTRGFITLIFQIDDFHR